jgi:hypothetical protein
VARCNRFVLSIDLENDAMQDQHDVAGALRKVADRLNKSVSSNFGPYCLEGKIQDRNGNTVGKWEVKSPYEDNDE